ncbi:MAG TPA: hypothetical protein VF506_21700, partial [Streptosporangiaceae bacterium]
MTIDHTAARIGDLMSQYPAWAPYLAMKVARGDLTEDEGQLRHDLDVEDARLRPLPNDQWGRPHITWDLDPARWH